MTADRAGAAPLSAPAVARNSVGVCPTLIGYAKEMTGSFTAGLMVSAFTLLASTLFTLSLRRSRRAPVHSAAA